ncbi:UNVERIFIED_ORG: L-threonine O-3-phosphate decarboxylase [Zoogloea ramigera]|uniref:threonine-phosphate decarboxylase n=1 Tax=Duganella zoogloeoides TaxID=75659 RepID=A0ABZ0XZ94_9BURK|nr:threonine-phosphate decarboxylase CobD [Duganella zoogloeoides]WQH05097.1 threonine-phosphate decarboxylase CobD [Duganella zoogloeoides]
MLEHGGNLRDATLRFGRSDWLDLSTGLNPRWYPAPALPGNAWHRLPEASPELAAAAQACYGAPLMLPVAGTQAAIQALPRMRGPSRVTVAAPSYAEHAHHWHGHGHTLTQTPYAELDAAIARSDVVVVCNPNNPTGATVPAAQLLAWGQQLAARGGWLVVDEAFGDTAQHNSVAAHSGQPGLIVLRSVGKFFGLAGIRLGFVAAHADLLRDLADLLGPWTISGPAQHIALAALHDRAWQADTHAYLHAEGARLAALLASHGIASTGTPLFQWWAEPQPEALWQHMAERGVWVRLFREAARGIRLGLPPEEAGWRRLESALKEWTDK